MNEAVKAETQREGNRLIKLDQTNGQKPVSGSYHSKQFNSSLTGSLFNELQLINYAGHFSFSKVLSFKDLKEKFIFLTC